jgi:hypothetical protein
VSFPRTTPPDPADLNLATLDAVKLFLGLAPGDTSKDVPLQQALAICSALISDYTGRYFARQDYIDTFGPPHDARGFFSLMQFPVQSIKSILVNGQPGLAVPTVEATSGPLGTFYLRGHAPDATIQVTYSAGYDIIPLSLMTVLCDMIRRYLAATGVDLGAAAAAAGNPIKSISIGQLKVDYAIAGASAVPSALGANPVLAGLAGDYAALLSPYIHPRMLASSM